MKKHLYSLIAICVLSMLSFAVQAANVITMTTSLPLGSQLRLNMKASGNVVVDGATGTFISGRNVKYTTTKDTIKITGDVTYFDCDNDSITSLDVSNDLVLQSLHFGNNPLKSIDLSKNTALLNLSCANDKLTSLDISKNTLLTRLSCNSNKIASLDVSNNTALTQLLCMSNQLTSLDVGKNTSLTLLMCGSNQLTFLDVSKNTLLNRLDCNNNQLTSLDLSSSTKLSYLSCFSNKIKGAAMDALIASLDNCSETSKGKLFVISLDDANEGNVITSEQVSAASTRGWNVFDSKNNPYLCTCAITLTTSKNIGSKIIFSIEASGNVNIDGATGSFISDNYVTYVTTKKNITITGYVTSFICDGDSITSLNVSKDTLLAGLSCYDNQLTSLDISKNAALGILIFDNNYLESLDASNNHNLVYVGCSSNKIKGAAMDALIESLVDYSKLTQRGRMRGVNLYNPNEGNVITSKQVTAALARCWDVIDAGGSMYNGIGVIKMTTSKKVGSQIGLSIKASNNTVVDGATGTFDNNNLVKYTTTKDTITITGDVTELSCLDDSITSLDVSKDTLLTSLYCNDNQLTSLNVSNNALLVNLTCWNCHLDTLDVSKCTSLLSLACYSNKLKSLDLSKNTALMMLLCDKNQLGKLDLSKNTALTYVSCNNNQLNSLDLSNNTALTDISCNKNQLKSLDVSKNIALTSISCVNNLIDTLDVSKNIALTSISCGNNNLTTLDVSKNTALKYIGCGPNYLETLDVSKNTALKDLNCVGNKLNTLDVSKNTALKYLNCSYNNLDTLDVSKNTALKSLFCSDNKLDTLDLSKNTLLESLYCNSNSFRSLDLSHNTELCAIYFANNKIKGTAADALISSLVDRSGMTDKGDMFCIIPNYANEGNVITTEQVAAATARGWNVFDNDSNPYKGIGVIKLTTSGEVGSSIKLAIKANGNVTIDGANDVASTGKKMNSVAAATPLSNSSEKTYVTTSKTITIIGDITTLDCRENKLETLDVSSCPTLNNLVCSNNKLTTLDVSQNAALDSLDCSHNSLATLDVSKNQALLLFYCNNNKLTALDLINNPLIETLWCYNNGIKGTQMDALISSLSNRLSTTSKGAMQIIDLTSAIEGNIMTTAQVSDAKARGWNIFDSNNKEYAGSVPSGISGINADGATINVIYDTTGQRINQLSRGVNIVKMSDGKIKKVIVKQY